MILYFYEREAEELVNKLFDISPKIFTNLNSVKIQGDTDVIPLPFYSFSTMEKSVRFILEILERNEKILLYFDCDIQRFEILISVSNYIKMQFSKDIDAEFITFLYPLYFQTEKSYFYSPDFSIKDSFEYIAKEDKPKITEAILKNYNYSCFVQFFSKKIKFEEINENEFTYLYHTFLPESINSEGIIRLLVSTIAYHIDKFKDFLFLRASDNVEVDKSVLKKEKKLIFIIPKIHLNGELFVKEKRIVIQKSN